MVKYFLAAAALVVAGVPAAYGLAGNDSFSRDLPVRVPEQAQTATPTDAPTANDDGTADQGRGEVEPGDDHGGDVPRDLRTEAGDDHGAGHTTEPGDDHGGTSGGTSGHHAEPGDDHGGTSGTSGGTSGDTSGGGDGATVDDRSGSGSDSGSGSHDGGGSGSSGGGADDGSSHG